MSVTSYPLYSPSDLLYSEPFRRIFDDVYILDESDLSIFYQRALTIYEHFGDILFEYFRNNIDWIQKMEPWINQFIFQWNMSRKSFDAIWDYLVTANYKGIGSGMYYIYVKGGKILVKDLEDNNLLSCNYERKIILEDSEERREESTNEYLFPPIIDYMAACREIDFCDPYRNIISCECFEGCPHNIAYEQIHSDIKMRFNEYVWDDK